MPDAGREDEALRECRVFTRYLVGRDPDDYVVAQYMRLRHTAMTVPRTAIDHALVEWGSTGPIRARIADAYSRIFRPRGLLRRLLILLFAILENSGAFHRDFTSGGPNSLAVAVLRLSAAMLGFAVAFILGVLVFAPRQLMSRSAETAK